MTLPAEAARTLRELARFGIHLGLGPVRRRLAALGNPERAFPCVLVAGTNGKGSTAALVAAMATAAGLRTGLYTSPHLERVEERVRLDGVPVDGRVLGEAVLAAVAAEPDDEPGDPDAPSPPTYFEALTAAAFQVFRRTGVDLAVLEVGLGGRLDATNAADPVLSVIAPVSVEHRQWLGHTVEEVAREKAGVLRRGRPAVAWGGDPAVRRALLAASGEVGADLAFADDEVERGAVAPRAPEPWGGLRVDLATPVRRYPGLETALVGRHQVVNLALAVRAAERLGEAGWEGLDATAVHAGAAAVHWPGRLESARLPQPLPAPFRASPLSRAVLDAAHNPAAAAALAAFLDADAPGLAPVLVFGALEDKEVEGMLPPLARRASRVVLTRPPSERAREPGTLRGLVPEGVPVEVEREPGAALERAFAAPQGARDHPDTLLVCGSIYLAGFARGWLRERFGVYGETGVVGDRG